MPPRRHVRLAAAATVAVLGLTACGSDDDDTADDVTDTTAPSTASTTDGTDDATAETDDGAGSSGVTVTTESTGDDAAAEDAGDAGDAGGPDDYTPGDIEFRLVNVSDAPVDVYVRTTGLVEAFLVEAGVAPGEVTDFVAPPADGNYVVAEAGAGDPTCVGNCPQFLAELSTFPEEGPFRTVVLHDDEFDGPSAFVLWEQPDENRAGSSNAMVPADPDAGLVVVTGIALTDAEFGVWLAFDDTTGCATSSNLGENTLVGGNQTPAFTYDGDSAELTLHANDDRECASDPVGGPFTVEGGPGTRSHVVLTGAPGDMDAIVLPMAGT